MRSFFSPSGVAQYFTVTIPHPPRLRSLYPTEDELIVVQHTAMQKPWTQQASNGLRATIKSPRQRSPALVFRRTLQDVSITRTGKPIIRIQGGR